MAAPYSAPPSLSTRPHPTSPPTALHRRLALQPPSLLTTSLDNARHSGLATAQGGQQTPVSTTSLSTPFSANSSLSPYPQSQGTAMRGASPLTYRSGPSMPYNPQQWGPVSDVSPQSASTGLVQQRYLHLAPRPVGPDEPVASPPPPYSPRRNPDSQPSPRNVDVTSPSATTSSDTDSPRYGTPLSTATTSRSPDPFLMQSRNRETLQSSSASASPNLGSTPAFPPPPPVGGKARSRAVPKISTTGILSSLRTKAPLSAGPRDAINVSQGATGWISGYAPESSSQSNSVQPPSARRAASTGHIGLAGHSSHSSGSNSPGPASWESNNVSLPPPPPGPPPAASRTQSLNRFNQNASATMAPTLPFRRRIPPGTGTALGTVPPTPADWRDESPEPSHAHRNRSRSNGPSLHIDTGSILHKRPAASAQAVTASASIPSHLRRDSSSHGLFRSPALRNRSAKGIRERRSESRNGKGRDSEDFAVDDDDGEVAPWQQSPDNASPFKPADLVIQTNAHSGASSAQSTRLSPRSGKSMQSLDGAIRSPGLQTSSAKAVSFQSLSPTAQPDSARSYDSGKSHTPVFSPKVDTFGSPAAIHSISSPRTVGPPGGISLIIPPNPTQRPISHILHMPIDDDKMQVPLTPSTKASQRPVSDLIEPENPTAFAARANERHRKFVAREAAAESDAERLDLFMQFIVAESRIRREQYSSLFEREDIDIDEMTEGLFGRSPKEKRVDEQRDLSEDPPSTAEASRRGSNASSAIDSSEQDESSSASRMQESPGSVTSNSSISRRPESGWAKEYVPCLSPIASMSIVTGQDEMDSRGRAPSRWWEGSRSGDAAGDGFDVPARSKRESKYMGVSKDAPMSPVIYENPTGFDSRFQQEGGEPSQQHIYGPGEYPPEKVGWHEQSTPQQQLPPTPASAPYTPSSSRLDISRLITLPPPYPRHHPAVNNSHPELDSIRSVVRSLHDTSEIDAIRTSYRTAVATKHQRAKSWQDHQRSIHQQTLDFSLSQGDLSPTSLDAAEAELSEKILQSQKETTQATFDLFQKSVVTPLHALHTSRIATATSSLHSLSTSLFSDAQSPSPNLPQEEGDEKPELLERLTMLKWLFEAREAAHRGIYDLLSERNELYKAIVLLPYTGTNPAKQAEAESFFASDARDRLTQFHAEIASRSSAFLSVIETNVSRGVEVQLDAFWQIAPPLKSLLDKIPTDLESRPGGFDVLIPPKEYAENPSYVEFPLQYLYSLLGHAERASYQFIESQVNLLCLLHEIRGAEVGARVRAEVPPSDGDGGEGEEMVRRRRGAEDERLTKDLQEKVGVVEGQWEDALGGEVREVMERIRGELLMQGGWVEDEDGGEEVEGGL